MSINASLSSDGLEEFYTPPTLKEMCLYKCLTNKQILIKQVKLDEGLYGSEKLDWKKFRLKEPIQRELMEALLEAGKKYLFLLTPKYVPVLLAIRMSQPEHLVKVHVSNTYRLVDCELEFLISGGNVKSLDIHGCESLGGGSLDAINKYGSKLEYLRIGDSTQILPEHFDFEENSGILRTPNLKTFIISEVGFGFSDQSSTTMINYWKFLALDFISNLEDLRIGLSDKFQSLEFLEPAKSKLTSLTISNWRVTKNANTWASLFKLDKLRSLDLVGSSIGEAFIGENVVQLLLAAMPNLTRLAIDPGLVKDMNVGASIRGQGSAAKRLEFLGIMDNDEVEIRKAKLLANDVAHFGTVEGELRSLEYFSNLLNWGFTYSDSTLERLLNSLSSVNPTLPWKTVGVISLLLKTIKNNGTGAVSELFFSILKKLLTTDVAAKMGKVLVDQCVEAISAYLRRWAGQSETIDTEVIKELVDIIMNLDGELRLDHYVTVVPTVMLFMAESREIPDSILDNFGTEGFKDLMKKTAQLLEKVVDRFPGEINELWGISSVLEVIKKFRIIILSGGEVDEISDHSDLVEIFSSMIISLRKLCQNSSPRRKELYLNGGVTTVMDLLTEMNDDCVGWADRDSFALLEILESFLQDTKLPLSESGIGTFIASGLEKLLVSVHSIWELWTSSYADGDNTHYLKMESIAGLLNYLESDPRFDYKISTAVKLILVKLKQIVFH